MPGRYVADVEGEYRMLSLPTPYYERDGVTIYCGDCREIMPHLDAVDSVVTDPPYELGFMGKAWDKAGVSFDPETWRLVLEAAKPGAMLLSFGGTRTWHRLACAVEDAGWEIRDTICWMYGSGFPKSLDISKAIDKAAGAEREVVGAKTVTRDYARHGRTGDEAISPVPVVGAVIDITTPATDAAREWDGWGTALKPAFEPIVVAMKPLDGTFAENALRHGVAGLNIDGCRIGTSKDVPASPRRAAQGPAYGDLSHDPGDGGGWNPNLGRWPANVILECTCEETREGVSGRGAYVQPRPTTDKNGASWSKGDHVPFHYGDSARIHTDPNCPCAMLDAQSGERTSGYRTNSSTNKTTWFGAKDGSHIEGERGFPDSGGASRFFYCSKASRREREMGLDGMEPITGAEAVGRKEGSDGLNSPRAGAGRTASRVRNTHPTVKPLSLMRYLCRLTRTPTGGVVLDPFMGSGTTLIAARLEGRPCIGIDLSEENCEIAVGRLSQEVMAL